MEGKVVNCWRSLSRRPYLQCPPMNREAQLKVAFRIGSKKFTLTTTEVPAYSDTLGTWEKCHCNQIVTVTIGSLVKNQSFGTCQKYHCKRGVTLNSVTVSGEICRSFVYQKYSKQRCLELRVTAVIVTVAYSDSFCNTDFPAYSVTVYSDTPLTVTLLACPK